MRDHRTMATLQGFVNVCLSGFRFSVPEWKPPRQSYSYDGAIRLDWQNNHKVLIVYIDQDASLTYFITDENDRPPKDGMIRKWNDFADLWKWLSDV